MVPELRPRGIGEMLDAAVALYRGRFGRLVRITIAVVVPVQIINSIVLLSAQPDGFQPNFSGGVSARYDSGSTSLHLAATVLVFLVTAVSTAFITAVCTRIVADAYVDHAEGGREAVRLVGRRIFAVIGVSLLVTLMQVVGVFACGVGTFVALALFSVAVPALILEGSGVFRSLGRSFDLAKTNFWRALLLVMAAQALTAVLTIGLAALVALLVRGGNSTTASVIGQGIASAVASAITTPFVAAAVVILYFDMRIRNEAFDLQLTMQRRDAGYALAQ